MRTAALVTVLAATATVAHSARAQNARIVDQGSFTITVNNQRIGREDFRIAATPRGTATEHIATATVTYGDRRLEPKLMADSAGVPSRYEITSRNTGGAAEQWSGQISRGRVRAEIQTDRGPAEREYIVTEGAIIVDDDVFHQYYFVAMRRTSPTVTIMIPRRNTQVRLQVAVGGSERIRVGTQDLDATKLTLTETGGGVREVWVDAAGMVLKVAIPARNLVALRDDPPR